MELSVDVNISKKSCIEGENMKKSIIAVVLALVMVVAFVACNPVTDEDLLKFSEKNEKFTETLDAFKLHCDTLIDEKGIDETTALSFETDLAVANTAFLGEAVQYLTLALYNSTGKAYDEATGLTSITKSGDTYTMIYDREGTSDTTIFKSKEETSSFEMREGGTFSYSVEKLFFSENEFAVQFVMTESEGGYNVWQLYINGTSGRLAAGIILSTMPASIYDNKAAITTAFATGGERSYIITADDFVANIAGIE